MMDVAIIGTGNMANGIGSRVVAGNNTLTIYGRDGWKAKELARKLGKSTTSGSLVNPIEGDIIILALPYSAIPEVIEKYKDQFSGKVLVDISNPIDYETFELIPPPGSSGAEEIAKLLPEGSKLVKAFNTTFAGTLTEGKIKGFPLDVFIASDDKEAGMQVAQLAASGGLRGLYIGELNKARLLEELQLIQVSLQEKLGTNWKSGIKVLP